jgi:hypothetical protein
VALSSSSVLLRFLIALYLVAFLNCCGVSVTLHCIGSHDFMTVEILSQPHAIHTFKHDLQLRLHVYLDIHFTLLLPLISANIIVKPTQGNPDAAEYLARWRKVS